MIVFAISNVASTILKKGDFGSVMLREISELESKSGTKLTIAQKILLAETGTVEQVLSILTGYPVSVRVLKQKEKDRIITRESVIVNEDTSEPLIRAYSKAFKSNLPLKALNRIKQKQAGIGSIIYGLRLETIRKIVEVGYNPRNGLVFRKYEIIHNRKVIFEIKEELLLGQSI